MASHYNEKYYFSERRGGIEYMDSAGQKKQFGYQQGGLWNFQSLIDKLIELLGFPDSVIDSGAGCGGLISTFNSNGVEGIGLEFSQFAIDNAILDAGKYLRKWNIEDCPWCVDKRYDWVLFIDVMEHLFGQDVDRIIAEAKRVAKKYIIAKICTAQLDREIWAAKKAPYEEVVAQAKREGFEWLIASGHVNCQVPAYWVQKFEDSEWKARNDLSERLKKELKLPLDWRTTIILERKGADSTGESPLPKTFTSNYYDAAYFAKPKGKRYRTPTNRIGAWSYGNPTGEYLGCRDIAKAWKIMFNPEKMLDAFCGRGTFIAYSRDYGINAVGFDYSDYAVKNPYPRCKPEWLTQHDATKPWPYADKSFDFVTVLDAFEHLYIEDVPKVIEQLHRVASKWIFIQTAIPDEHMKEFTLEKGKEAPLELEKWAVAGHLTLLNEEKWESFLEHDEWVRRRDLEAQFKTLVPKEAIANWLANLIMIYEKVE